MNIYFFKNTTVYNITSIGLLTEDKMKVKVSYCKGALTRKLWPRVFFAAMCCWDLLAMTRQIICCRTQQTINYRLFIIDQFQFRSERAPKTTSRRMQLSQPSVSSSRPCQHTEL
uniref:Uncharacterized protein n=1 Tax=Rhipicephalus microplus TaxID=6941 RepID=A0A6G5AHS3_RHIMP